MGTLKNLQIELEEDWDKEDQEMREFELERYETNYLDSFTNEEESYNITQI